MKKFIIIILSITVFSCDTSRNEKISQDKTIIKSSNVGTYCNPRFGYCIDYPKDMFYPQPESQNGDGRIFLNKNKAEVLIVYGTMCITPEGNDKSLREQLEDDIQNIISEKGKLTYKKIGINFYVLSGYKNDKIFYQKTILKEDVFACAILQYNETEKNDYNIIAKLIFESFK